MTEIRDIPRLPVRSADAHKGDVGRVVVVGGSFGERTMIGAPALAANAALRCGAGLVQVLAPKETLTALAVLAPCATFRSLPADSAAVSRILDEFRADVLAVGPGLGVSISGTTLLEIVHGFAGAVVLDADGLTLLASVAKGGPFDPQRVVLTPHPGEMRTLLQSRGLEPPSGNDAESRLRAAHDLARTFGCVAVLKGAGTVVTDGQRVFVNPSGNAGMATAGAGDVLTGVVAALIGQKMSVLDAAVLGVHLHGLAGDRAAARLGLHSLMATDLLDYLPEAFGSMTAGSAKSPST